MSKGDKDMPRFELKKFKSQRGHEGVGFYCLLHVDGVKGAEVIDEANGGMYRWHWFDPEAKRKWDDHVAAQPEEECGLEFGLPSMMKKPDADSVMARLADEHQIRETMKRKCRTQTLYRLKGDKPEEYWVQKVKFTAEVARKLRDKYGDALVEIINETLAKEPTP